MKEALSESRQSRNSRDVVTATVSPNFQRSRKAFREVKVQGNLGRWQGWCWCQHFKRNLLGEVEPEVPFNCILISSSVTAHFVLLTPIKEFGNEELSTLLNAHMHEVLYSQQARVLRAKFRMQAVCIMSPRTAVSCEQNQQRVMAGSGLHGCPIEKQETKLLPLKVSIGLNRQLCRPSYPTYVKGWINGNPETAEYIVGRACSEPGQVEQASWEEVDLNLDLTEKALLNK